MRYRIVYLEEVVRKDIPALDPQDKLIVKKAIEEKLLEHPIEFGKPMQYSLKGCRRLRVGDYRVLFIIEADSVVIVKIGPRKEIYRS